MQTRGDADRGKEGFSEKEGCRQWEDGCRQREDGWKKRRKMDAEKRQEGREAKKQEADTRSKQGRRPPRPSEQIAPSAANSPRRIMCFFFVLQQQGESGAERAIESTTSRSDHKLAIVPRRSALEFRDPRRLSGYENLGLPRLSIMGPALYNSSARRVLVTARSATLDRRVSSLTNFFRFLAI